MRVYLSQGINGDETRSLQKALNELGDYNLAKDGSFGPGTKNAYMSWQQKNGYIVDGIYNSEVHKEISELIDRKYIRFSDIDDYAIEIGIEPSFLKALTMVESPGSGFFNNGMCTILFERHVFFNQVVKKYDRKTADAWSEKYPNICYLTRSQSAYLGGSREWSRLDFAKNLDAECALKSASYGMFQIMGFNYEVCGYDNIGDYVADMMESERFHIGAVSMFIKNQSGLIRAARNLNFNEFARLYNGPQYAAHNYHTRLKSAFDFFKKQYR